MLRTLLELSFIFGFIGYCVHLYVKAKLKHRKEWLRLHVFLGKYYGPTLTCVPRALLPLFRIFERRAVGLIFAGVQCIVRDTEGRYLMAKYKILKQSFHGQNNYIWDLGAAGMISSSKWCQDPIQECTQALKQEFAEELGLDITTSVKDLRLKRVLTPYDGINCIIYCFECILKNEFKHNIRSTDDTFVEFQWLHYDEIMHNYTLLLKPDAVALLKQMRLT